MKKQVHLNKRNKPRLKDGGIPDIDSNFPRVIILSRRGRLSPLCIFFLLLLQCAGGAGRKGDWSKRGRYVSLPQPSKRWLHIDRFLDRLTMFNACVDAL